MKNWTEYYVILFAYWRTLLPQSFLGPN